MEKLKRKLSLLNIPVYEVDDDRELINIIDCHLDSTGDFLYERNIRIYYDCDDVSNVNHDDNLNFMVFNALIGVSESSILFFNNELLENISKLDNAFFPVLTVKEKNVVDFIEVALHRISNGSIYNNVEIITPEAIPHNALVVFLKE